MEVVIKLLAILGLGAIELWAAIPAGLALQLHPMAVGITAAIGAMLGALVVVLLGKRVRTWLVQRHSGKEEKGQQGLIHRIWHRYGVIGLGLLAPLLIGAPLGAALGLTLGVPGWPPIVLDKSWHRSLEHGVDAGWCIGISRHRDTRTLSRVRAIALSYGTSPNTQLATRPRSAFTSGSPSGQRAAQQPHAADALHALTASGTKLM